MHITLPGIHTNTGIKQLTTGQAICAISSEASSYKQLGLVAKDVELLSG
jgi:hypothetical protein